MFRRNRQIRTSQQTESRSGAVLVENAIVSTVFGLFLAGIMEIGHAYMVMNTMNAAVKRAARYGSTDGVTTTQVKEMANRIIDSAFTSANATILVKDASVFDSSSLDPENIDYDALPDIELDEAQKRQMFVVRATVPYDSVALLPPFWIRNVTLKAQAVMRHE